MDERANKRMNGTDSGHPVFQLQLNVTNAFMQILQGAWICSPGLEVSAHAVQWPQMQPSPPTNTYIHKYAH